jgi:hypothetical protein
MITDFISIIMGSYLITIFTKSFIFINLPIKFTFTLINLINLKFINFITN